MASKAQQNADTKNRKATEKAKEQLRKLTIKDSDDYMKRVGKASKQSAIILREQIADKIDRPTNFTQSQSTFHTFQKISDTKTIHKIGIKDTQDRYLSSLFKNRQKLTDKFIPINTKYVDGHGNIKGLNMNKQSGRYKEVKSKQKKFKAILVDTTQKDRAKRIIAIKHNPTKRKSLFDWDEISTDLINNINKVAKK